MLWAHVNVDFEWEKSDFSCEN